MNVKASMSISLLPQGSLWGLIACHHSSPKLLSRRVRLICESLGQIVSGRLVALQELKRHRDKAFVSKTMAQLRDEMSNRPEDFVDVLFCEHAALLSFFDATGAAIFLDGQVHTCGQTPEPNQLESLVCWLEKMEVDSFHCHDLPARFEEAKVYQSIASGLLAFRISSFSNDWVIWFRPEVERTVNWAGNPQKPLLIKNGMSELYPRHSFELWKETVHGTALPWQDWQISSGSLSLRSTINDLAAQREKAARERNLKQLNAKLQEKVEELAKAHNAALAASALKSQFVANISHEIRTPMTGVVGLSELLTRSPENLDSETREIADHILQSSKSLLLIVNDLLDFSKLEADALKLSPRPFKITDITSEISLLLDPLIDKSRVSMRVTIAPDFPEKIVTDPDRLRQVILNLMHNAVKFTERGTIEISISPVTKGKVLSLQCSVRDTGIGIPEEFITSLFEPFTQARGERKAYFSGTGLGLSISKRIIQIMSGEIGVTSVLGEGSNFWFTVPVEINR
jgi:light-regulated signal transduction histidine kinase (bacteriophytochrome)